MIARERERFGYRRITALLRREGWRVNHKRVWSICHRQRWTVPKRRRQRLRRPATAVVAATPANQRWAMDYVSDSLASGRKIRTLTLVDTYTRECLALEVDTGLPGPRVRRVLERVAQERLRPEEIRVDNGLKASAFVSFSLNRHGSPGSPLRAIVWAKHFNCRPVVFHVKGNPLSIVNTRSAVIAVFTGLETAWMTQWKVRTLSTRSQAPQRPV